MDTEQFLKDIEDFEGKEIADLTKSRLPQVPPLRALFDARRQYLFPHLLAAKVMFAEKASTRL